MKENLRALLSKRPGPGKLVWIGLRAERRAAMDEVVTAELIAERGLRGDYTSLGRGGGKRQVSLFQAEHLDVVARLLRLSEVTPERLRRNLVVEGINLMALRARKFRVGDVWLEGTGTCEPCSKMERELGVGGYNALRGHGGILARVLEGGTIRLGDEVDFVDDEVVTSD